MEFLLANLDVLLILAAAGCAAGFLAGLFGIGGGLVMVPVIFFVLQGMGVNAALAMSIAVSTSLVAIIPTATSSVYAHHKLGNVDWPVVWRLAPALLLGVLVGSQLIARLRSQGFVIFFGVFVLIMAANMLWRGRRQVRRAEWLTIWVQAPAVALIGGISAVAGVGGGTMSVPLLAAVGLSMHRAIGSSAAFGLLIACFGATSIVLTTTTPAQAPPGTWRLVYVPGLCALVPLTVLMAPRGVALGKRLSPSLLRKLFAGVMVVTGVQMLYSVLGS